MDHHYELLGIFLRRIIARWLGYGLMIVAGVVTSLAQTFAGDPGQNLRDLTFEELANITVTTVSKKEEPLFRAAAAVTVLTNEDIRRSGATSVPEALRWVPGLDVAQISAADWAVSARGFNGLVANKLLVMIDGRTVYTPLLAGVFWDTFNPMLEDLDRIEVVCGPGGTLWGANAVNGVINILSKSARDTQGTLVYGGGGTEKLVQAGMRHGVALNEHTWVRVYASYNLVDEGRLPDGSGGHDGFHLLQGGFRLDAEPVGPDRFTLQGDAYHGQLARITSMATTTGVIDSDQPIAVDGVNLLGRWARESSANSTLTVQAFWDHTFRNAITVQETRNTLDVDVQNNWKVTDRHAVTGGLGIRSSNDHTVAGVSGGFVPADYDFRIFSGFVQDEITLLPDRLKGTLGVKLEHNSFTGFSVQPSVRLLWTPNVHQSAWASISRAVRNPTRADEAADFNVQYVAPGAGNPLPIVVRALGNPDIASESLVAYEAGWRLQPHPRFSADLAVYYNDYNNLILGIPNMAGTFAETALPPLHLVVPVQLRNAAAAHSYGGELSVSWQPSPGVRCSPFYSVLKVNAWLTQPDGGSLETLVNSAPRQQGGLRTSFDLPADMKFDLNLRWVGAVPAYAVAAYFEADVRFAWEIKPGFELAVTGQNLIHAQHNEFGPQNIEPRYELQRGIYFKMSRRF
jgi:iron complex outermembrane receptor protein